MGSFMETVTVFYLEFNSVGIDDCRNKYIIVLIFLSLFSLERSVELVNQVTRKPGSTSMVILYITAESRTMRLMKVLFHILFKALIYNLIVLELALLHTSCTSFDKLFGYTLHVLHGLHS